MTTFKEKPLVIQVRAQNGIINVPAPDMCAECNRFLTHTLYHTMYDKKNKSIHEVFCDAYCSLAWYEKNKKNHKERLKDGNYTYCK